MVKVFFLVVDAVGVGGVVVDVFGGVVGRGVVGGGVVVGGASVDDSVGAVDGDIGRVVVVVVAIVVGGVIVVVCFKDNSVLIGNCFVITVVVSLSTLLLQHC